LDHVVSLWQLYVAGAATKILEIEYCDEDHAVLADTAVALLQLGDGALELGAAQAEHNALLTPNAVCGTSSAGADEIVRSVRYARRGCSASEAI
jgi:hypothetical protein